MRVYPGSDRERRVPHDAALDATTAIVQRCAMDAADARLLTGTLASADLHGIHSHGVLRAPDYVGACPLT